MTKSLTLLPFALALAFAGCEQRDSATELPTNEQALSSVNRDAHAETTSMDENVVVAQDPKRQTEDKLKEFYKSILSENESARIEAISSLEPTADEFEFLFGNDDGAKLWREYAKYASKMRGNTDKIKAELERGGKVRSVKAVKISLVDSNEFFRINPDKIPRDVHAFKENVTTENGGAGGGNYYHFSERVVFIREPTFSKIVRDHLESQ